jgi:hypothetical protein
MQETDGPVALTTGDGDTNGSLWRYRQHQFREVASCAGSTMESSKIPAAEEAGDAGQHRALGGNTMRNGCEGRAPRRHDHSIRRHSERVDSPAGRCREKKPGASRGAEVEDKSSPPEQAGPDEG